ncbi:hypothetical protein BS78_01G448100 [Paspalum vaginatum]|nr:hypothetical protein BS78_01G448100 [Paspalum vaginatum]
MATAIGTPPQALLIAFCFGGVPTHEHRSRVKTPTARRPPAFPIYTLSAHCLSGSAAVAVLRPSRPTHDSLSLSPRTDVAAVARMGGAAPPAGPGEAAAEVTELELRIQLLGGYNINDNADLLAEILARLDGRSLAAAASVCRLWAAVARRDAVWEALCLRHVGPAPASPAAGPATRAVVAALGGYRRLYRLCLGPALDRLGRAGALARAHHLSLSLSLSLFSIDCYERLGGGGAAGRQQKQQPSSLLFLCKPVDVS